MFFALCKNRTHGTRKVFQFDSICGLEAILRDSEDMSVVGNVVEGIYDLMLIKIELGQVRDAVKWFARL